MDVDPDTVLWADDAYEPNGPSVVGWAKALQRHGYRVTTATSTGEMVRAYRHKMRNEGKIFRHVILDLEMGLGDCPADIERKITKELGPLAIRYSSAALPPILREETGIDITAGALTGHIHPHHTNTKLEEALTKTRFQYVLSKSEGEGEMARLPEFLRNLERPMPEDKGLNILVLGERGSGKTTTCSLIYGMQRGDLQPHTTALDGPIIFPKLTNERVNEMGFSEFIDESHIVKQLPLIEPILHEADRARLLVYYVHEGRRRRHHLWIVKKEGKRLVQQALESIGVSLERKAFYSFEDFSAGNQGLRIDYTTNTTNIIAARKIIDYSSDFGGKVLPVRIDITPHDIIERIANRARVQDHVKELLQSDQFKNASLEERNEMILKIRQTTGKRLHYRGKLTDFGFRTIGVYEQNERWRNVSFPGLYRIRGEDFLADVFKLQEEILKLRRASP